VCEGERKTNKCAALNNKKKTLSRSSKFRSWGRASFFFLTAIKVYNIQLKMCMVVVVVAAATSVNPQQPETRRWNNQNNEDHK